MLTINQESMLIPAVPLPEAPLNGTGTGEVNAGVVREEVLQQLAKILISQTFVRSKRLGRFLRFTVEQSLDGQQGTLKEYLVGVEVFNKQETFDPRIDSIVRVEARRLRSKMDRYYSTEGRNDQMMIQYRKGSYVPVIGSREQIESMFTRDGSSGPSRRRRSIAITQFTNAASNPAYDSFSAGLVQDLITAVTKIPGICLLANADQAKPDFLLEGTIRQQGDRVRISAQLIDSGSNTYVWSETFDRNITDAFAVQDEIANSIQSAIRLLE